MSHIDNLENDAKTTFAAARELVTDLGKLGASWLARSLDEAARALRQVADRIKSG